PPDEAKGQSERVPGAPSFGQESVVDRGAQGMAPDGGSVRPGLHRAQVGSHTVAWWDPNVLALEVEENVGVRQQSILEPTRAAPRWLTASKPTPSGKGHGPPRSPAQANPVLKSKRLLRLLKEPVPASPI